MTRLIYTLLSLALMTSSFPVRASDNELEAMDRAWAGIEAKIHAMGATVRDLSTDPKQRYDGYKAILSILTDQYVNAIYADRDRPETLPLIDITNNCAPGGDYKYSTIQLKERASYRVWGNRGTAQLLDFQQMPVWIVRKDDTRKKISLSNTIFDDHGITVDAKGNFDFIMSEEKPKRGQWFKLDKGATVVLIREMFSDYRTQNESAVFHVQQVGFEDKGPTIPTADVAADRLASMVDALNSYEFCITLPRTTMPAAEDNIMRELHFKTDGEQVNQRYITTRFNIQPGEALVGEWAIPKQCEYWNMTLYTDMWQTLGQQGFNRQTTLNHAIASTDKDGIVRFVISHEDPGVANWLDVDGYNQGIFIARGKRCPGSELISAKLVPIAQVKQNLPKGTRMVTAEQRARDLDLRRRHFLSIYRR